MIPTATFQIHLLALGALITALAAGCAGGRDGYYPSDGSCLRPAGCPMLDCCSAERACSLTVCEGVGYVCGWDTSGGWSWQKDDQVLSCDDGDACTERDSCVSGKCLGQPMACTTPPPATCTDGTTLRSSTSPGSCLAGTCTYNHQDTTCPQGCANGSCTGQPCLGIQCNSPPSECHVSPGTCAGGSCSYTQKPVGAPCGTGDPCNSGGSCDAQGKCSGTPVTCQAPNASGTCVNGQCNYSCNAGWGDCSGGWADGCETQLNTTSNCGSCGKQCASGANATASCVSEKCTLSCKSPYKDCDGKASNGCEIPVGVPNRCDKSGLNSSTGCGTAWCGSSSATRATNFGTWTCVSCVHCHHFSDGWSWCLSGHSRFSSDRCASCCNSSSADKVCAK